MFLFLVLKEKDNFEGKPKIELWQPSTNIFKSNYHKTFYNTILQLKDLKYKTSKFHIDNEKNESIVIIIALS